MQQGTPTFMKRALWALALIAVSSHSASALELTCGQFQRRVNAQLLKTKLPADAFVVSEGRLTETTPHVTHDIHGSDGVTGSIECYDADALREIDLQADGKDMSAEEREKRFKHLENLSAILTCALKASGGAQCQSATSVLFSRVRRRLAEATQRKDPLLQADEDAAVSGFQMNLAIFADVEQFTLTSDKPLPAH